MDFDGDRAMDVVPWRGLEPGDKDPQVTDPILKFYEQFVITDAHGGGPDCTNRRLEFSLQAGNPGDQLRVLPRGCCPCE